MRLVGNLLAPLFLLILVAFGTIISTLAADKTAGDRPLNPCAGDGSSVVEGAWQGCIHRDVEGHPVRIGRWVALNSNGEILQVVHFNTRGERSGVSRIYYQPSGKLRETRYFIQNRAEGKWTIYYENGEKKEERNYSEGKLHGVRKHWDENGEPAGLDCFLEGERKAIEECLEQ